MSVDVRTEVDIARPVDMVATYATDSDDAPLWYANIESVEWKTERALRTGAVVSFVAPFLGRRLAYDYELIEYTPGERLVMRTTQARSRWRPPTRGHPRRTEAPT